MSKLAFRRGGIAVSVLVALLAFAGSASAAAAGGVKPNTTPPVCCIQTEQVLNQTCFNNCMNLCVPSGDFYCGVECSNQCTSTVCTAWGYCQE